MNAFGGVEAHMYSLLNGGGGAAIKSAQRGTTTLNTATTVSNLPITSVDLTRSFVIASHGAGATNPTTLTALSVSSRLTSATNLQLTRQATGSSQVMISWTVIEFVTGARVQQVISTLSAASLDVAISAVDLNRSFTVHTWDDTSAGTTWAVLVDRMVRSSLTSSTNLHLERIALSGVANVVTYIVEVK